MGIVRLVLASLLLAAAPAAAAPTRAVVYIRNFAFVPASLTVAAGSSVTFINQDQDAHTVTGHGFNSGGLDTGAHWVHRFTTPGMYAFVCELHPYMHGSIIVRKR